MRACLAPGARRVGVNVRAVGVNGDLAACAYSHEWVSVVMAIPLFALAGGLLYASQKGTIEAFMLYGDCVLMYNDWVLAG